MKRKTLLQKMAFFYALNFLIIVGLSHWPGLTDSEGRLLGLFIIDPMDDVFYLALGAIAEIVAWHSHKWTVFYFRFAGIPFLINAISGLLFSREFLNGDLFIQGFGSPNLTMQGLLNNGPHILIPFSMLFIVFAYNRLFPNPV